MMQENTIFALDIGTHSVVGVLAVKDQDGFTVLDYEQYFHRRGAMRDGQIEDIHLVATAVEKVRQALEERNTIVLDRASIAAAGRSLVTVQGIFEQDVPDEPLSIDHIRSLEYGALSAATDNFTSDTMVEGFSCVGYSITAYWLDDYRYTNLEGHQGRHAKVDLIAAFLPRSVIRSLYTVTERCGLAVDSLTLEPIAAIEAIVPPDIRLLNLALVDIGAGTSDIAISKNGSIVAYDMATLAGDELTEAIMQHFLVDFSTAEMLKHLLNEPVSQEGSPQLPYSDILGLPQLCTREDILAATESAADALCSAIAESIRKLNQELPVAIFLVGGGSRFPTLCAKLADKLELPAGRVALGGTKEYKNIRVCSDVLLSPEFVTPLGIVATSQSARMRDFYSIHVNGQKVLLWEMGSLKVLDALLLAGVKANQLIGHTPTPLSFTLNGVKRTVRGSHAIPGELYLNDAPATLDSPVHQGDQIIVSYATDGKTPQVFLSDLLKEFGVPCLCRVNGREAPPEQAVEQGDSVELISVPEKVYRQYRVCLNGNWVDVHGEEETGQLQFVQLLNYADFDPNEANGVPILTLNGKTAAFTDPVSDNDEVEIRWSGSDADEN